MQVRSSKLLFPKSEPLKNERRQRSKTSSILFPMTKNGCSATAGSTSERRSETSGSMAIRSRSTERPPKRSRLKKEKQSRILNCFPPSKFVLNNSLLPLSKWKKRFMNEIREGWQLIGKDRVEGLGKNFFSHDPATGAEIWRGKSATAPQVDAAVQKARET